MALTVEQSIRKLANDLSDIGGNVAQQQDILADANIPAAATTYLKSYTKARLQKISDALTILINSI